MSPSLFGGADLLGDPLTPVSRVASAFGLKQPFVLCSSAGRQSLFAAFSGITFLVSFGGNTLNAVCCSFR